MTEFIPQNELETLLIQSATDPGARPAFYRAFLDGELLVIGEISNTIPSSGGYSVAQVGGRLSVMQMQGKDGKPLIPVFSSLPRLQEAITQQARYVQLKGRALLDTVGTALPVVLNPMSPYGKEFLPQELAALMDGSMFKEPESYTLQKDTQVLLGQPADYPQALVDGLKTLFSHHPQVEKAYLAQMYDPTSGTPPHPVVGIQSSGDFSVIVRDAGLVSEQTLGKGQFVDFSQLHPGEGDLSDYMLRSVEPFYSAEC